MHINSLKFDILSRVFIKFYDKERVAARSWKPRLELLSVCRKWRQIALPMVHKDVVVGYNGNLWSNMDIMTAEAIEYPRRFLLQVECKHNNPTDEIHAALVKLQSHKKMFLHITCLTLSIVVYGIGNYRYSGKRGVPKKRLQEMAKMFKELLPNITTLLIRESPVFENCTIFLSALYSQYAPQLKKAGMRSYALSSNTICFGNLLTSLSLTWYEDSSPAPAAIDVSCLTQLCLHSVTDSFKWSIFGVDDNETLVFPALSHLFVHVSPDVFFSSAADGDDAFGAVEPRSRFGYKLVTPRLQCLKMEMLCSFALSILMSISAANGSPLHIDKLCITAEDKTRFTFYGFCFSPTTKQLFEKYFYVMPPPYPEEYAQEHRNATNRLVGVLQSTDGIVRQGIHVSIGHRVTYINNLEEVEHFYWPHVTKLTIDSPISLTNLLALVESRIPNLVTLEVNHICIDVDKENGSIFVPELLQKSSARQQQQQHCAPIMCRHLTAVVYGFDTYDNVSPELGSRVEEFMFEEIKTLKYCLRKPAHQW